MKDASSLHMDAESLDAWYERVREAYGRIFESLGLNFVVTEAENSVMGGASSEEFVAPVDTGTCEVVACEGDECRYGITDEHLEFDVFSEGDSCPDCGIPLRTSEGIEVGHVFKLGTRYSEAMDLTIDGPDGSTQPVVMGSYGIGITRLIQTLIEQHGDEHGCRWPITDAGTVAPFEVAIIPLEYEDDLQNTANHLHEEYGTHETLLFDNPDQSIGERFAESDLLGIPLKIILGNHFRETGEVELETRDGQTQYVALDEVPTVITQRC
jgi:prolyl-tRNA synthetase